MRSIVCTAMSVHKVHRIGIGCTILFLIECYLEKPYNDTKKVCRFVNDVLQIWERKKNLFRGAPIERTHREIVVLTLANGELLLEIVKGKELV